MMAPIRPGFALLGLMAAVVLVIAAANVATLLLRAEWLPGEVALSRAAASFCCWNQKGNGLRITRMPRSDPD